MTRDRKKRNKLVTNIVAGLMVAGLSLYMVTFQVRSTEVAVVTTFGKPTRAVHDPGLYWKWPFPVQKTRKLDKRIQQFEGRLEQVFTADDKNVIICTYIGWRINDPIMFMTSVGNIKSLEKSLEGQVRSYINGVISEYYFSNLISERKDNIRFDAIEKKVLMLLNEGEKHKNDRGKLVEVQGVKNLFGIEVVNFGIKRLELPEKTTEEVFNRMREERKRIAERYRSRGKSKAKNIKTQAKSEEKTLIADAQAKAIEIKGRGDAAAAMHYQVFSQNHKLALFLLKLETLQKVLTDKTTLLLDTHTVPYDLLQGEIQLDRPTTKADEITGEVKNPGEVKKPGKVKDASEVKTPSEVKDAGEVKDSGEVKDPSEVKDTGEVKDPGEVKDTGEAKAPERAESKQQENDKTSDTKEDTAITPDKEPGTEEGG